ncbi:hypothetical protein J2S57_005306 [Kineosporia succinea]|uniref:Uncharacterized protein n=1 Tax=Kineosporia succinea TaxID=84632 RepID=A0ABT9PA40_9ACTN|nr:hypothetical protein [Kineosporia succinea]
MAVASTLWVLPRAAEQPIDEPVGVALCLVTVRSYLSEL